MKVKVILRKLSSGKQVFQMRFTDEDNKKRYRTLKDCPIKVEDWKRGNKDHRANYLKKVNKKISGEQKFKRYKSQLKWIEQQEDFYNEKIETLTLQDRFVTFESMFEGDTKQLPNDVYGMFLEKAEDEDRQGRFSNARQYRSIGKLLNDHIGHKIRFEQLTPELLTKFKQPIMDRGCTANTVSNYLRTIRALYNYAIKKGVVNERFNPFRNSDLFKTLSNNEVEIIDGHLTQTQIEQLKKLRPKLDGDLREACNYFLFGYYAWGMNYADIARLKHSMIKYDNGVSRITYIRYKIRNTVKKGKKKPIISLIITPEMKEIIDEFKPDIRDMHNDYVFPILNASHSTEQKRSNRVNRQRGLLNQNLKELGKEIGVDNMVTYTWRHSFSYVAYVILKVGIERLSQMLGHTSIATTQSYVTRFPEVELDQYSIAL